MIQGLGVGVEADIPQRGRVGEENLGHKIENYWIRTWIEFMKEKLNFSSVCVRWSKIPSSKSRAALGRDLDLYGILQIHIIEFLRILLYHLKNLKCN